MKETFLLRIFTNKKVLGVIGFIVLVIIAVPLMFIIMLSTFIGSILGTVNPNIAGNSSTDVICTSIEHLKTEYGISNDISSSILRAIDLLDNQEIIEDKNEALSFVGEYIKEEVIEADDEDEEDEIVYYFYTDTEIINKIKSPPISFDDESVEVIYALALAPVEDAECPEFSGTLIMPCDGAVTSGFGMRIHPVLHKRYMHYGIDIGASWHSPLVAVADGVVVEVNTKKGDDYGNNITIKHKTKEYGTFYTSYNHLSQINVRKGQKVTQGEVVALEGGDRYKDPNPGYTTGHHLHFEIRTGQDRKTAVDPMKYLSGLT